MLIVADDGGHLFDVDTGVAGAGANGGGVSRPTDTAVGAPRCWEPLLLIVMLDSEGEPSSLLSMDFERQNFSTSIQVAAYRNLTIKPRAPVAEARKVDCEPVQGFKRVKWSTDASFRISAIPKWIAYITRSTSTTWGAVTNRLDVDPVTAVTLWQFGEGRLLSAQSTLPLIPLGTAPGGAETTYLYQALNQFVVTTTYDDGFLSVVGTRVTTTPRTVIADASGWFEAFDNEPTQTGHTIACSLVNSVFGDCADIIGASTVTSNSGSPIAEVFGVSLTAPPTVTPITSIAFMTVPPTPVVLTGPPTPTSTAFSSASAPTSKLTTVRAGPIVGSVVGGFVVLGTVVVALWVLCRRRRRRLLIVEEEISPRAFTPYGLSSSGPLHASTHNQGVYTRENLPLLAAAFRGKGAIGPTHRTPDTDASLMAGDNTVNVSGLTTPQLARILYERVYGPNNIDQVQEDVLPPLYNSDFAHKTKSSMPHSEWLLRVVPPSDCGLQLISKQSTGFDGVMLLRKLEDGITATGASAPWSLEAASHIPVNGIDMREHFAPQPLRAVPSWRQGTIGATQWSSDPDVRFSAHTDSYGEEYSEVH
ncbi:hypothetical protein GGX14DRAFT_390288 [Mycena pura]|uniref:Transmembrane protein n=1 Tax=Mycena pura TaxID=153505 RepID=A0AAD6VP08_9AGAR|nr:hypothetical protein GGX14DRAFT_390288 [Mycena pura]